MSKTKKILVSFSLVFIFILSVLGIAALAGCAEEETKYDVAIRVACSDGTTYDFPVGTDERHITIPYDGTERTFWVDKFNLPDHPRWSDEWISPSGEGANVFISTFGKVDQKYDEEPPESARFIVKSLEFQNNISLYHNNLKGEINYDNIKKINYWDSMRDSSCCKRLRIDGVYNGKCIRN